MRLSALLIALLLANLCQADSFCFAQAQSYYEQLYCEIQAKGKGRQLPRFDEFTRSNEMTQALLLKRPASNAGVAITMPKSAAPTKPGYSRSLSQSRKLKVTSGLEDCRIEKTEIRCASNRYRLLGNRSNKRLTQNALSETNKLDLPRLENNKGDSPGHYRYLSAAYRHYLKKMMEIGLAGATMSYGKFEYLFHDLHKKGVDFYARFETMYGFLKKDKRTIGVSESLSAPSGISLESCGVLDLKLVACVVGGRNYLYQRMAE